jgi:pimeloyl-ACP methyl ester carboxylesterase
MELRAQNAASPQQDVAPRDAVPVWFEGCFGWFHPGGRGRGVVLCSPIGPESDYVHRVWRGLAQNLVAAGLSVLRFDYPGTRDSLNGADPARPVQSWIDSIAAASHWLTVEAGVEDVALVGLRFGAALAVACAETLGGIERLALLAPVASGAAYCRELAMLARVSESQHQAEGDPGLDDGGLGLSQETMDDIRTLEIAVGETKPARRALILPRPGAAGDQKLTQRLIAQGVEVEQTPFDGYAQLMTTPEYAAYPEAAFATLVDWLSADMAAGSRPARVPRAAKAEIKLPGGRETALFLRPEAPLFGIASLPRHGRKDLPAVVFLNTGAISHAGMNGMWPRMARRLAQGGMTSLRFDISGFGDSPSRPGQLDPFTNMGEALGDVDAAIAWLQSRGHTRITLIGFCWGAQLACNVALRDRRVSGMVMINPRRLFWRLETPPDGAVRGMKGYLRLARDPARWRSVLSGGVSPRRVAEVMAQLLHRTLEAQGARARRREAAPQAAARMVRSISARGADAFVVQGFDDPFLAEFEDYFGVPRTALPELFGMQMEYPAGVDHLFRNDQVRAALDETVAAHLGTVVPAKASKAVKAA